MSGDSCACKTGDCFAKMDYEFSVSGIARDILLNAVAKMRDEV